MEKYPILLLNVLIFREILGVHTLLVPFFIATTFKLAPLSGSYIYTSRLRFWTSYYMYMTRVLYSCSNSLL